MNIINSISIKPNKLLKLYKLGCRFPVISKQKTEMRHNKLTITVNLLIFLNILY